METNYLMTEQEIKAYFTEYIKNYDWHLIARCGYGNRTDDTYLYHFVDDAGICIDINPSNKGFSFRKNVQFLFKLTSEEFTPFDHDDGNFFQKNYLKFRKIIIDKELD